MKLKSVGTNITLGSVALVVLIFSATIWVITNQAARMQKDLAIDYAQQMAQQYATTVKADLELNLNTARTLASSLAGMQRQGIANREIANAVLRQVLINNPHAIGVWTAWEPNAFDGKDRAFAGKTGSDATGRFIPYWNRANGRVGLEPLHDYDKPGVGDWYQIPKRTHRETITEPLFYRVGGKNVLMTSLVVPIMVNGQFVGVAGVDVALSELQSMVSQIKPYGHGFARVISYQGRYVAAIDPHHIGDDIEIGVSRDTIALLNTVKKAIQAGRIYRTVDYNPRLGGEAIGVYVPIGIGTTATPWSFSIKVPLREVLSGVTTIRNLSLGVGIAAIALLASMIFAVLNKLTKLNQDLTRSNQELEQFAYVASHDLQEPLRMISSYTQLLTRRYKNKLDQDADEFMEFIVDAANRMQRLINDLLAFSRLGRNNKPFQTVKCEEVLKKTLFALKKQIEEQHAQISCDSLPAVSGDEGQLAQLFQNLISNAIKFHKKDEPPKVYISARGSPSEWIFSVRDNGIGIDPQFFERIFIIFQRLHGKTEYSGTGIGLSICKKIVERHGGKIWVQSKPDLGTTISFSIPK